MALTVWKIDFVHNHLLSSVHVDSERQTLSLTDSTLGGRTQMWKGTLKMIRDHPILGTGMGTWQWIFQQYKEPGPALPTRPEYAHNDFLNLASDYGLVGFLIVVSCSLAFGGMPWP